MWKGVKGLKVLKENQSLPTSRLEKDEPTMMSDDGGVEDSETTEIEDD